MKETTTYTRAVQYLGKLFKLINEGLFDGELETPTITVQSTVGAYGHITNSKIWKNEHGADTYELNIGADYLSRPIENIVTTLVHEACHLYDIMHDIKDTSNQGVYHNARFKEIAESKGLEVIRHPRYGWAITNPTDDIIAFCLDHNLTEFLITRDAGYRPMGIGTGKNGDNNPTRNTTKKGNSLKWVCPVCGAIVRSTRIVNIVCGDCGETFILA